MKKGLLLALVLVMAVAVIGCAGTKTTWQGTSATSFELGTASILQAEVTIKGMCDNKTLKAAPCNQFVALYAKAKATDKAAAAVLKLAYDTADVVQQKAYLTQYSTLVNDVTALIGQIATLATQLGIKIGGA